MVSSQFVLVLLASSFARFEFCFALQSRTLGLAEIRQPSEIPSLPSRLRRRNFSLPACSYTPFFSWLSFASADLLSISVRPQVYAGDLAKAIEIISRSSTDPEVAAMVDGKIIEAGGPTGSFTSRLFRPSFLPSSNSIPGLRSNPWHHLDLHSLLVQGAHAVDSQVR